MRLIDADALREVWLENGENEYIYDTNIFLNSIDDAPTVDAVPVVHARWIVTRISGSVVMLQCSACKKFENPSKTLGNYCWNCGARMDGDTHGTD